MNTTSVATITIYLIHEKKMRTESPQDEELSIDEDETMTVAALDEDLDEVLEELEQDSSWVPSSALGSLFLTNAKSSEFTFDRTDFFFEDDSDSVDPHAEFAVPCLVEEITGRWEPKSIPVSANSSKDRPLPIPSWTRL